MTGDRKAWAGIVKSWLQKCKQHARQLHTEIYALYLAYQDPRVPWYARALAVCVAAYAFSPIDLIPDFIPVVGYLDDLIILPLGAALALKMIPVEVMTECRSKAAVALAQGRPVGRVAAAVVVVIWLALATLTVVLVVCWIKK
jgi:uncharacterized membrane protein YkvA (DUF1232 family)